MREVSYILAWTNLGLDMNALEGKTPSSEWRNPSDPTANAMLTEMDMVAPGALQEELNEWLNDMEDKDKAYVEKIWPDIAEFVTRNNLW